MQFKLGKPILISGHWQNIKEELHRLIIELQQSCNNILVIDTTNSINPHHPLFRGKNNIFRNIHYARTPRPYDLWARLQTAEQFIKAKKIEGIIITSLSLVFADAEPEETRPLLNHILKRLQLLTKKYRLITVIGNSPGEEQSNTAFQYLRQKVIKVVR